MQMAIQSTFHKTHTYTSVPMNLLTFCEYSWAWMFAFNNIHGKKNNFTSCVTRIWAVWWRLRNFTEFCNEKVLVLGLCCMNRKTGSCFSVGCALCYLVMKLLSSYMVQRRSFTKWLPWVAVRGWVCHPNSKICQLTVTDPVQCPSHTCQDQFQHSLAICSLAP